MMLSSLGRNGSGKCLWCPRTWLSANCPYPRVHLVWRRAAPAREPAIRRFYQKRGCSVMPDLFRGTGSIVETSDAFLFGCEAVLPVQFYEARAGAASVEPLRRL